MPLKNIKLIGLMLRRESLFLRKIFPDFLLEKSAKNHATANAFGCPDSYMDTSRFASNLDLLVLGYDCTRISDLKVERISSGHNGLFARLLLIVLACLKHFELDRFCKRRFDLFAISTCCFTIVSDFLLFILTCLGLKACF